MVQQTLPLLLALVSLAAGGDTTTSSTPATADAIVEELNLLRSNPNAYADILEERLQYYNGDIYHEPGKSPMREFEGRGPVEETIAILRSMKPLPTLRAVPDMNRAAQDHADSQRVTGETGHTGSGGSDFADRIDLYGAFVLPAGEAISYGPATARDIVAALVVDDGVPDRGHRHTLLDPTFAVAGVGYAPHPRYRFTCVIDFAQGYEAHRSRVR